MGDGSGSPLPSQVFPMGGALKESTAKLSVLTRSPRARIVGPANMEVLLLVLVIALPVSNVKEDVLVLL